MEFAGVRSYQIGDDFRLIDWNAFRRTGRPVTRMFAAEEQMPIHLLVDATGSMGVGNPSKYAAARKIAVALGYLALRTQNHMAGALLGPDDSRATGAERGAGQFHRMIRLLLQAQPRGEVDLGERLRRYAPQVRRPAVVVVLTDGLEPGALDRGLRALRLRKAELVLIQILASEDLRVPLPVRGAAEMVDAETGRSLFVPAADRTREEYERRFRRVQRALRGVCVKHRVGFIRAVAGDAVFPVVMAYLKSGTER
jgi:uncharacterized protein (DUF58 family)